MPHSIIFFYITFALYFVSAFVFASYLAKRENQLFSYFKQWLFVASASGVFFFLVRYWEAGYLPLVTLFEIAFFYAWMISVFCIIFVKKEMARFIQCAALLISYTILVWNIFMDKGVYPINSQLDSFWLGIHVPAAILSYSAFALSFAISLYYIFAERRECLIQ